MNDACQNDAVISHLMRWAELEQAIRVMLLTSTRARADARVDLLSDYDVLLFVPDATAFAHDTMWLHTFGNILVQFRDERERDGVREYTRLVFYADGTKIDFTIASLARLRAILASPGLPDDLDVGYRVLLDKETLTTNLPTPTFRAYIPTVPTEEMYRALVEELWWETTYVAKCLWRDELLPAKYSFESVIKLDLLRRMLEWSIEIDHGWQWPPGVHGRGFKRNLSPEIWAALEDTFAGASIAENWRALFATTALFRTTAAAVAQHLGYRHAHDLDARVTRYLEQISHLPRGK